MGVLWGDMTRDSITDTLWVSIASMTMTTLPPLNWEDWTNSQVGKDWDKGKGRAVGRCSSLRDCARCWWRL